MESKGTDERSVGAEFFFENIGEAFRVGGASSHEVAGGPFSFGCFSLHG